MLAMLHDLDTWSKSDKFQRRAYIAGSMYCFIFLIVLLLALCAISARAEAAYREDLAAKVEQEISDAWERILTEQAEDIRWYAVNCYFEARSEYTAGGHEAFRDECRRITWVVLNRINDSRWPGTVKEVITEGGVKPGCQFSWHCDGKSDRPGNAELYKMAQVFVAELLLRIEFNIATDDTLGAHSYHAAWMGKHPFGYWRGLELTVTGAHHFYRDPATKTVASNE